MVSQSGTYNDVDIEMSTNNFNLTNHFGAFAEMPLDFIPNFSINVNSSTYQQVFFITPVDYNPPDQSIPLVVPNAKSFPSPYRAFTFSLQPYYNLSRYLHYRFYAGYELHYFHHRDKAGIIPYDASDR